MPSKVPPRAPGLLLCGSLIALPVAAAEQPRVARAPGTLEELGSALVETFYRGSVPGAQAVVIEGGEIVRSYTHGLADVARGAPVTETTMFRAGSISKSFVAVAAMIAVEEGWLDLSMPVAELVPDVEFENPWEATEPVRLVHLLEHTAGFYDIGLPELLASDPAATIESGLALGPHQRVSRWPPGSRAAYCNSGPPIVALALERLAGQSFEELVDRRIIAPLGMAGSSFHLTGPLERRLARSYRDDGVSPVRNTHPVMRPSGGLNTTALALGRFVLMLLGRGELEGVRLLTPESVARMERSESLRAAVELGHESVYGLGNMPIYSERLVFRGHDGGIDGFSAAYAYAPRLGAGTVLLVNGGEDEAFVRGLKLILEFLTRDYSPELPPAYPRRPEELAALAGSYVPVAPRSRFLALIEALASPLRVDYSADEGLIVSGVPRIPRSRHGFRRPERAETSFVVMDNDGTPEIHFDDSSYRKVSWIRARAASVLPLSMVVGLLTVLLLNLVPLLAGGVRRVRRKPRVEASPAAVRYRILALLSAGSFLLAIVLFGVKAAGPLDRLTAFASVTPLSATLFALSALSPLLAVVTLGLLLLGESGLAPWRRGLELLALVALLAGQAWLAAFGWIPLRTWIL